MSESPVQEVPSVPATLMWHYDKDARATLVTNESMEAKIQMMKDQEKELWRRMDDKLMEKQQPSENNLAEENKALKEEVKELNKTIVKQLWDLTLFEAIKRENESELKEMEEVVQRKTSELVEYAGNLHEKIDKLEDEMDEKEEAIELAKETIERMMAESEELKKSVEELTEEVKGMEEEQERVQWKFVLLFFFFIFTNVVSYCNGMRNVKA